LGSTCINPCKKVLALKSKKVIDVKALCNLFGAGDGDAAIAERNNFGSATLEDTELRRFKILED
jgi:hypothetical protein